MIVIIDNYDSFVYNIARYVRELGFDCVVHRNDQISIDDIKTQINPSHIIISPGPCTPNEAGISIELIRQLCQSMPILGICLGHQAIGQAFGATIKQAVKPMHGMSSLIWHDGQSIYTGIANPLTVARYHSLVISEEDFPEVLEICARSQEHEIMAVRHRHYPVYGMQFHLESVLTKHGYDMLRQFLQIKPSIINTNK